ncbi:MAG: cellulase family glycosylhydrolase [Eudoraea sp.]|nr:cellulase family glycosylhydrolase [Eudoraea sp.]
MAKRNKLIYRSALLLSFIGINALILMGIGAVISYLNTGADRSSILHLGVTLEQVYLPKTSWAPPDNEGRRIEQQTLLDIKEDYLRAWYVRAVALRNNDPYGLDDYYTESMRTKMKSLISQNRLEDLTVNTTTLNHNLHLDFYSADGKVVSFTDSAVTGVHELYQHEKLIHRYRDITTYRVVMLLEDGFWRIRHQEALKSKRSSKPKTTAQVKWQGINRISGINYYPKSQPWALFDTELDSTEIEQDLMIIKENGLNTLRIFVPYPDFGKASVATEKMERLVSFLNLADAHQLKVIVTLFDFYGDYSLPDWTLTHRHAEAMVQAIKGHPALLAWDIKNEPDLDFESRGKDRVQDWLREMINQVKSWDSLHPVTIGWSNPQDAELLHEEVDFVSFHYYQAPEKFQEGYNKLKKAVGNKEVLLEEFGYSSYSGLGNLFMGSEQKQKRYYQEMIPVLKQENIHSLLWTLHDFEEIPDGVVGKLPWRKGQQKHFGLLRSDGTKKPAFDLIGQ